MWTVFNIVAWALCGLFAFLIANDFIRAEIHQMKIGGKSEADDR